MEHLLYMATSHFVRECVKRGVKEIAIGKLIGLREEMDYGDELNQRLPTWPYRKLTQRFGYQAGLAGITVRADVGQPRSGYVHERNPSRTSHACGKVHKGNRVARGTAAPAVGRLRRTQTVPSTPMRGPSRYLPGSRA